jgi:hypothetical protein
MPLIDRQFGIFPRWPENGTEWIHPDDVETLTALIPSNRIFLREWTGGPYSLLIYGDLTVRANPAMWEPVLEPEYRIGDEVEICSLMGKNEPGLAVIREMYWDPYLKCARYELEQHDIRLPHTFTGADLRPVEFLT